MARVPDVTARLIARFGRNRDAYRSGAHNEAQARCEFADPLFEALGWKVCSAAAAGRRKPPGQDLLPKKPGAAPKKPKHRRR